MSSLDKDTPSQVTLVSDLEESEEILPDSETSEKEDGYFEYVSTLVPQLSSTIESFSLLMQRLVGGRDRESSYLLDFQQQIRTFASEVIHMQECLDIYIEKYIDDPDLLLQLIDLRERLYSILESDDYHCVSHLCGIETQLGEIKTLAYDSPLLNRRKGKEAAVKEEIEEPEDNLYYCKICFDNHKKKNIYIYSQCLHYYCKPCLKDYYTTLILQGYVENINCPDTDCQCAVRVEEIERIVDPEVFVKYQNYSLLACLHKDPTTRWCPLPGCNNVMTGVPESNKMVCNRCLGKFCYECRTIGWHEQLTCEQNMKSQQPDDPKTAKWKKKHRVKKCPYCGLDTIRASGCPDIFCVACKRHWDWYYDIGGSSEYQTEYLKQGETMIESAGFFLPRMIRETVGSREMEESPGEMRMALLLTVTVYGPFLIPMTVGLGPAALSIRAGRKVKHGLKRLKKNMKKKREEGMTSSGGTSAGEQPPTE